MKDDEYEARKRKEDQKNKDNENRNLRNQKNKEFSDKIHMQIHAVRLLQNYKASPMEINISRIVIERFKDECKECKDVGEKKKTQPVKKEGFITKLGNLADK